MSIADTAGNKSVENKTAENKTADERRVSAWIGQGVVVEGRITSAQDLRIDGKVDGTIAVGDYGLIIGASAAIKADLIARSVLISGTVTGNVTASDRVDVHATGSVEGDITTPRLVLADGAMVKGKVDAGSRRAVKTESA
jgi:cytoskeletal protein CcmA (bactofilin family)